MDARIAIGRRTLLARLLSGLAFAGMLAGFGTSLFAQTPPSEEARQPSDHDHARVARLVTNLGSPSYSTRNAADHELANIGALARKQIEAAAESDDLEIRTRARRLLRKLKVAAMWQPSLVDLPTAERPAGLIIQDLNRQTGNHLLKGNRQHAFREGMVTLTSSPQTFWRIVDDVCRQTGNRFQPRYKRTNPGWVMVAGELGNYPVAYAGPVRARITSARRVFVDDFDYRDTTSEVSHTLQFNLQLSWEDQFHLVAYQSQLRVDSALDDTGTSAASLIDPDDDWRFVDTGRHQVDLAIRVQPPAASATQLETLTLRWPLLAVGDMTTLETDHLEAEAVFRQDDAELVIERIRQRGSHWEVTVAVTRDLAVPEPRQILFLENEFELIDEDGKSYPVKSTTKLGITAGTARLKLKFTADSPGDKAARLRMRYPQIRDQRDLSITFRNVPIPGALPK